MGRDQMYFTASSINKSIETIQRGTELRLRSTRPYFEGALLNGKGSDVLHSIVN